MVFRWPIEIDGLPNLKMVIFHGELLNNQSVNVDNILIFLLLTITWKNGRLEDVPNKKIN